MYIWLKNEQLSYRYDELNLWRENDEKPGVHLRYLKFRARQSGGDKTEKDDIGGKRENGREV